MTTHDRSTSAGTPSHEMGLHPTSRAGVFGLLGLGAAILRYRFFVIAGAFPYLLGAAVAYNATAEMNWLLLALGLGGVVFVSLGIEGLNEYFDSRIGGDRVFAANRRAPLWWHLPLGVAGFGLSFILALYLVTLQGWPVLIFGLCGGAMALSYLVPPVYLSYRGLGETVIALGYGPGLVLGSFYLQTGRLSWQAALVSLVPGLMTFAVSLANEVPDYYGDRLVGKKNLVVRAGRRTCALLYGLVLALLFLLIAVGLILGVFPAALGLCLLLVPVAWWSARYGVAHCLEPLVYIRVVRTTILMFVAANTIAILGYVLQ